MLFSAYGTGLHSGTSLHKDKSKPPGSASIPAGSINWTPWHANTHPRTHARTHSHTQRRGHKHEAVHREVEGAYNHSMYEITKELKVFLKMKTCVCVVWIHFSSNTVCVCLLENTATRAGRVSGLCHRWPLPHFQAAGRHSKAQLAGARPNSHW